MNSEQYLNYEDLVKPFLLSPVQLSLHGKGRYLLNLFVNSINCEIKRRHYVYLMLSEAENLLIRLDCTIGGFYVAFKTSS